MASGNEPTDRLLKPGEVARLLRVTTATLTTWSRAGKLTPVLTPGGHHRYRASEIAQITRNVGEVVLNKNGSELDVWLRVNGRSHGFSTNRADVERFLAGDETCTALPASVRRRTKSPLGPNRLDGQVLAVGHERSDLTTVAPAARPTPGRVR